MTMHHVRPPVSLPLVPQLPPRVQASDRVFGAYVFEVTVPEGQVLHPVEGWTLRLWPQARLGDGTLEARADGSEPLSELLHQLGAQRIRPLGPIRVRKSG